jgi:heme-degrading monooxygenase HmoA
MHVNFIEWRVHPFRRDRFLAIWTPALDRALAFGAKEAYLTRNYEDPLHLRQVTTWESRDDFDRFWASDEVSALRQEAINYYNKPVLPVWHVLIGRAVIDEEAEAAALEAAGNGSGG